MSTNDKPTEPRKRKLSPEAEARRRASYKVWQSSDEGRAYFLAYYHKHRDKHLARVAVRNAIRDGRLVRGPCEVCGGTERIEGHHDDHSKPLQVRWLCKRHHEELHHGGAS